MSPPTVFDLLWSMVGYWAMPSRMPWAQKGCHTTAMSISLAWSAFR